MQLAKVRDPVAEGLGEGVSLPQGLDGGIVVVNHIAITAVSPQGQAAIEADNDGAIGTGAAGRHIHYLAQIRDRPQGRLADRLAVSPIDVGVVGEHIADGVRACLANPLLDGAARIIAGHGGIVGALDGDDETGAAAGAGDIKQLVIEPLGQGVAAQAQCLDIRVVVVDHIAVTPSRQQIEGAVLTLHRDRDIGGVRGGLVAGGLAGDQAQVQSVAIGGDIHVRVIADQVALGIIARQVVGRAARLDGDGAVVVGDGSIVDRVDGDEDAGGGGQGILGVAGDPVAIELVPELAVVIDQDREGVAAVVVLIAPIAEGQQGGIEGGQVAGQYQLATAVVADDVKADGAAQGEHPMVHRQGQGEVAAARVYVGDRQADDVEIQILIHALARAGITQGGGVIEFHIADVGPLLVLTGIYPRFGERYGDLAQCPAIAVDADLQGAGPCIRDGAARRAIEAIDAGGQNAEGEAAIAIRGGVEALVVHRGGEIAIQPAPDQGHLLVGKSRAIGAGISVCAGGVVPQGTADDSEPGRAGEHIVVERIACAILAGALAACLAIRADAGAAPAGETFRQAGPGQGGIGAGNGGAIGQVHAVGEAHFGAHIQLGEIDREAAALGNDDGDAGRQAIVVAAVAAVIGISDAVLHYGQAGQRIVAAPGKTVGQARFEGDDAPGLLEVDLNQGRARVAVDAPGVEIDDRLVKASQTGFYDALKDGGAGATLTEEGGVDPDIVFGDDPELGTRLVAQDVVNPHVEFDGDPFQVAVKVEVVNVAQSENDGLVAIGIGDHLDLAGRQQALQAIGQGRGDGLSRRAGLIAIDVGPGDQRAAQAAVEAAVRDQCQPYLLLVEEAEPLGQADPQFIVVVVPLRDQGDHLVADDLAHGDLLDTGIRGAATGLGHAAHPGDENAAGDGDDPLGNGSVVVEDIVNQEAVGTGALTGRIGPGADSAIEAGPLHFGLIGQLGEVGGTGIDQAAYHQGQLLAHPYVQIGIGLALQLTRHYLELAADIHAVIDDRHQIVVAELAGQQIAQADIEGIQGAVVADHYVEADRIPFLETILRRGGEQALFYGEPGFLDDDIGGRGRGDIAHQGAAAREIPIGILIMQGGAIAEGGAILVDHDVVGDQTQPYGEAVVARVVVGIGAADTEAEAGIHSVTVQAAPQTGEQGSADGASESCGDELIPQIAVVAGIEPEPRGDQVVYVQLLGAPLRQGHHYVVPHALADHQVGPGSVPRTGGVGGIAAGEVDADGGGGDLLACVVSEVRGGEVLAVVDAGIVAEHGTGFQGAAGLDGVGHHHFVADDDEVAARRVGGAAIPPRQQGGDPPRIEEADGVVAHLIVGAQHQRGTVAAIELQVGRRQGAVQEGEAGRQVDAGDHIEGAATAPVLDGGSQAQGIATVYVADIPIDRPYVGHAAGEGNAARARGRPVARRAADGTIAGGDDPVTDGEIRFGDGGDDGDVRAAELGLVEGGHLARLGQNVEFALVGEGLIPDGQGEFHLDTAAIEVAGGIAAKVEDEGVAGTRGDADEGAQIGITAAKMPLADPGALAPVDAAEVKQRQGQVGGQLELFIVAGHQIVTEPEGNLVAGAQFDRAGGRVAIDLGQVDDHLAGGDLAAGLGTVGDLATGQVDVALHYGGGDGGAVAKAVPLVDLALGIAARRCVALADEGAVAQHGQGGTLQVVIEGEIARQPAGQGEGGGQGGADVEADADAAIAIDRGGVDQVDGLAGTIAHQGQGRGAGQGLAVAQGIRHHKLALAEEVLAEGKVVRQCHVDAVVQGISRADARLAAIDAEGNLLVQGDGPGGKADRLPLAGKVYAGVRRREVSGIQGDPLATGGRCVYHYLHRGATVGVDDLIAIGIDVGYVELDPGVGGRAQLAVLDGEGADEEAVAVDGGLDQGVIGDDSAIGEGNGGECAIGTRDDGSDLDARRQCLADAHIGQGLALGRDGGQGQGMAVVGAGGRLALHHIQGLFEADDGRAHRQAVNGALDQAGVVLGIVEGVIAELEAAAGAYGQDWCPIGEAGVGQVAQARRDLDGDVGLALAHAAEGDLDDDQGVPRPESDIRRPYDERTAIAVHRQGVGRIAGRIEGDLMKLQGLIQVGGLDEADAVVAILAGTGQIDIHIGGITDLAGAVAKVDGEVEGVAEQHVHAALTQAGLGAGVGEQAVEALYGFPAEGQGLIDEAALHLQIPVAPLAGGASVIAGGRHVGTGPAGQGADQGLSRVAGADPATVELDIRLVAQVILPALELLADAGQGLCVEGAVPQGELAGGAVGEDLDGIDLPQLGQSGADGTHGIRVAVDEQQTDIGGELVGQLAGLFDAGIDDQQLAGRGRLQRLGVLGRRLGGVLTILGLVIDGHRGRAIKQYPGLQGQHLLVGPENGG